MFKRNVENRLFWRLASKTALPGLVLALVGAGFATPAEARHHHRHHGHVAHHARHVRHAHAAVGAGVGGNAAIVVDGATGRIIYGLNENAPRHPASVTKVMTLYLLFEQLEKGRLTLDSEIPISAHAAAQSPSKLGLPAGRAIRVEDAIKAIVTKSCNDLAVAVAEAVGGTESDFAQDMTRKARELGMMHTFYRNASGLPNDEQITTAADLALLGRSIQDRFPRYYRYFSLHEFAYRGQRMHTHNHLMDRVVGMDGIKTGYTVASGFNLLTSVKRSGHYIVAVVMGGKSARARDNYMESLIEQHIADAGPNHAATRVAEREEAAPAEQAHEEEARPARAEPPKAEAEKKSAPRVAPPSAVTAYQEPASDPMQLHLAAVVPDARPRPAYVTAMALPAREPAGRESDDSRAATASIPRPRAAADGSTSRASRDSGSAATPGATRWATGPAVKDLRAAVRFQPPAKAPEPPVKEASLKSKDKPEVKADASAASHPFAAVKPPVSGWMIQIGATDDADKAAALLTKAKSQRAALLSSAHPYTEAVKKGGGTLYRARFAGLEESKAEAACKALKTSGFSCFATKN